MLDTEIAKTSPFYGVVDHVILQTCTAYSHRPDFMREELKRVGILRYTTIIAHTNPIELYAAKSVNKGPGQDSSNRLNCWFNHYNAVRISKDFGYSRVMLVEDDISFLKDLDKIREILSSAPSSFSMLHLDPLTVSLPQYLAGIADARDSGIFGWGRMLTGSGAYIRSAGCRILSAEAISAYVDFHERVFSDDESERTQLMASDMIYYTLEEQTGLPVYYSAPNLAIQNSFSDLPEERGQYTPHAESSYSLIGLDIGKYAQLGTDTNTGEGMRISCNDVAPSETASSVDTGTRGELVRPFCVDDMMRNAFVLCKSVDEYCVFCRRMVNAGFTRTPAYFNCLLPEFLFSDDRTKQVTACVYGIVRMAAAAGLQCVTVFECDCYPMAGCRDALDRLFSGGIPAEADLITFGNLHWIQNAGGLIDIDSSNRFGRISGRLYGSHAVTYLSSGYRRYLSRYMDKDEGPFNCDHFSSIGNRCFSTTRSYFLQAKKALNHSAWLADTHNLGDFPGIDPANFTTDDANLWPDD